MGDGLEGKIVFDLGDSRFGIEPKAVRTVTKVGEVIPCERHGSPVCGLVKVKGRSVPVYDVAGLLGCGRSAQTPKSRLIVAEGEYGTMAFIVDRVSKPQAASARAVVEFPDIARLI